MPSSITNLLTTIAIASGILFAVGSIGHALNLCNPEWSEFGVSGTEIRNIISNFPQRTCGPMLRPACQEMSKTALWFIGLDKETCRK